MPELPDLAVFGESLEKDVLNKRISHVEYHRKKRLNVTPEVLYQSLLKQKITAVKRSGKGLLFILGNGEKFLVHLMLSGGFKVAAADEEVPYAILTISFEGGRSLVLFDPRGLATVTLNPKPHEGGVDALELTSKELDNLFKKKPQVTIKELLIDQSLIAGIGNAYSDEILWQARISPKSIVGKIPEKAVGELHTAIHEVLKKATDYLRKNHPGMMSGEAREHLAVHKPKAKLSPTGSPILTEEVASKKTYYTEEQTLYH